MKKKFLLLASVVAAVGLVGATFAKYLVTDNADPFGVKVTPGTITTDTDQPVTLSWGAKGFHLGTEESTAVAAIENIENGATKGPYLVRVKADTKDPTSGNPTTYTGTFKFSLADNTGKDPSQKRLIDNIKVYATTEAIGGGATPSYDSKGYITTEHSIPYVKHIEEPKSDEVMLADSFNISAGAEGQLVYLYVCLKNVAAQDYEAILKDQVYLQVDWAPKTGDDIVSSYPISFNPNGKTSWGDVWVYAYGPAGARNAEWPGIKVTGDSYELSSKYTGVVFNNGNPTEGAKQTVDIAVDPAEIITKSCFTLNGEQDTEGKYKGSWTVPVTEKEFYVVGIIGGVEDWSTLSPDHKLTRNAGATGVEYILEGISLKKGDQIKVKTSDGVWYPGGDNWWITKEGTNLYDVYVRPNGDGGEGWTSDKTMYVCEHVVSKS